MSATDNKDNNRMSIAEESEIKREDRKMAIAFTLIGVCAIILTTITAVFYSSILESARIATHLSSSEHREVLNMPNVEVDAKSLKKVDVLLEKGAIRTSPTALAFELEREAFLLYLKDSGFSNKKSAGKIESVIHQHSPNMTALTDDKDQMLEASRNFNFEENKTQLHYLCEQTVNKLLIQKDINNGRILEDSNPFSVLDVDNTSAYYDYCGVTKKSEQSDLDKFYSAEIQEQREKFSAEEDKVDGAMALFERAKSQKLTEADIEGMENWLDALSKKDYEPSEHKSLV